MPPIWPYLALIFSGHGPIVWIRRSSGLGTFQTSLTPSSQTCGSRPSARSNSRIAAPVSEPQQPSASTVCWAVTSVPGSKLPSGSPSLPRPLSPVRTPRTTPSSTSSWVAAVSVRTYAPPSSASSCCQRASADTETTSLPWFLNGGGGGMRSAIFEVGVM